MGRHAKDQWDIASSVGLTALGVAGARAIESQRADGLIHDPYAAAFVHAAEADTPPPTTLAEAAQREDPDAKQVWVHSAAQVGRRTHYFDELLHDAGSDGLTQVVILAAGLDTRAYRLDWPHGFTVFEIDQPQVLQFKDHVLTREGAQPGCTRRTVPIDLREDWSTALEQTGFDRNQPTTWIAEGLLPYLPDDAEQQLLATVHRLSAPASRIALDHAPAINTFDDGNDAFQHLSHQVGINDVRELFYDTTDRPAPDSRLNAWGWTTTSLSAHELASHYGHAQPNPDDPLNITDHIRHVTAHRPR